MGAPSTPVLCDGTSLASFTGAVWNVSDAMGISAGKIVGSGAGRQSTTARTAAFTAGPLECSVTMSNGFDPSAETTLSIADALVNAHRYCIVYQSVSNYIFRRFDDDFTFTTIGSGSQTLSIGDKIALQRIGTSLNYWRDGGGGWSLVQTVNDSTYGSIMQYVGLGDYNTINQYDDFSGGVPTLTPSTFITIR